MKIKLDESKILEFKIDTSSGCKLEDLQGYLRFSFGGVEYGFPAKIEEGCFKVEVPPFKNVVNDKLTESISKNKELIVKGRLDVIANNNTYVTPWQGDIDIEIPVSMNVSEGKLAKTQKFMVSDPDNSGILDAFNAAFNPKPQEEEEKKSKIKDALDLKVKEKPEKEEDVDEAKEYDFTFIDNDGKAIMVGSKSGFAMKAKNTADAVKKAKQNMKDFPGAKKVKLAIKGKNIGEWKLNEEKVTIPKKSRFAETLEKAYVKKKED